MQLRLTSEESLTVDRKVVSKRAIANYFVVCDII